jgi:hypothetical protein
MYKYNICVCGLRSSLASLYGGDDIGIYIYRYLASIFNFGVSTFNNFCFLMCGQNRKKNPADLLIGFPLGDNAFRLGRMYGSLQ